ncbi:tRNA pseudouridine(38-40) synthase TruA [Sulfuriroseicoccus oceanibius]|uniref:tRNA pseudouridine synthase A n=1 Tax=Sulfuriroseicoccus oceanibius TaxID=2707525 RepID=A0A6B3LGN1_9BACT|nr:tRNA pseudouridine(38-40) synthase TruA [Sulfuriroseicoccus oceanibius]QQL45433.1 tRNA pseudouridine(38-40) synthase TruA [Sulfuriroseicoccus oceanibius]
MIDHDQTPRRIRLTIAYEGSGFSGWQSQPAGDAVQDHVQRAIAAILGKPSALHGSGRTDAGVHALGQVAHFDLPPTHRMDGGAWLRALNTKLPRQIRIVDAAVVDTDFHARFSATGKHYRYEIVVADVLPPFDHLRAWHQRGPLDLAAMHEACRILTGEHDFSAFCANRNDGTDRVPGSGDNVRHVTSITPLESALDHLPGTRITLDFRGNGFLYKMVRLMTGAIVRCGQHKLTTTELTAMLDRERLAAQHAAGGVEKSPLCAPADGLTLVSVDYS